MSASESELESGSDFVGDPDGLERLWTPHRMVYIGGEERPTDSSKEECPFCKVQNKTDEEGLIVFRAEYCFVVMNLFPYNSGHVLVCPYRHIADYTELTEAERAEFGQVSARAMSVLREVMGPGGFNLGMNQGSVAGAGIAAHLHQHVIPRWNGDANFFPLIARTKALPELLGDTRNRLAKAFYAG
jgi:Diadenosine tetraphosphate (Ap4A) hydrolase and other HIT family hydrolases